MELIKKVGKKKNKEGRTSDLKGNVKIKWRGRESRKVTNAETVSKSTKF